jgi:hypothetical protein
MTTSKKPDEVTLRQYLENRCEDRMRQHMAAVNHAESMVEVLEKGVDGRFVWM